jgi:hypothetical protein
MNDTTKPNNGHSLKSGLLSLVPRFRDRNTIKPSTHPANATAPPILPEMHTVTVSGPVFEIIGNDGTRRTFLCLGIIPALQVIAAFYDPEYPEFAQIFFANPLRGHEREQRRMFIGYAVLTRVVKPGGIIDETYLTPNHPDFDLKAWHDLKDAPRNETLYLLDERDEMALGVITSTGSVEIVTGPRREFKPVRFHYAAVRRMKGGVR